jgi:hypothetical protein
MQEFLNCKTQKQFAELVGYSESNLNHFMIDTAERDVPKEFAFKLFIRFSISMDWLYFGYKWGMTQQRMEELEQAERRLVDQGKLSGEEDRLTGELPCRPQEIEQKPAKKDMAAKEEDIGQKLERVMRSLCQIERRLAKLEKKDDNT